MAQSPQGPQPANSSQPSKQRMELVGQEWQPDPPAPMQLPPPMQSSTMPPAGAAQNPLQEMIHRTAWKAAVLGTLNAAVKILAARMIVLVAVVGGIGLTFAVLPAPNYAKLGALAIYSVFVAIPCVWLAGKAQG